MPLDLLEYSLPIPTPPGSFYGPCSGHDLRIALQLFGSTIDHFVFCDLAYTSSRTTAVNPDDSRAFAYTGHVPHGWSLVSRVRGADEMQPSKQTWYNGNRLFRPFVTYEVWRRADGSRVQIELRADLAQDVLVDQFASGSISAFMHVNDGTGEGGSDAWFLRGTDRSHHTEIAQTKNGSAADVARGGFLFEHLAPRLADGAVVITDCALADQRFSAQRPFLAEGRSWLPMGKVFRDGMRGRQVQAWRASSGPISAA